MTLIHNTSRTVRVFISSTFRDMHAERDYLVRHVFPELRSRCKARNVEFVEVDLRWGITEKQAQQGETLERCLEIINTCRPYFIGILGERYGWVPERDKIPDATYQRQPWLANHPDASVTELEILHGVLNNPDMAGRAFFYFRDPSYLDNTPSKACSGFTELERKFQQKLDSLKNRIRANRHRFPVREGYPNPKMLGQLVLNDLWEAIDRQFPAADTPEGLNLQAAEHQAFADSRSRMYTPRPSWQKLLDSHVASPAPPLMISGESGLGKSALLANWAMQYRTTHPATLVITHFIGISRDSARPDAILRRIMGELKRAFAITEPIPDRPEQLVAAFAHFLDLVAGQHRPVVIVIDALNQLDEQDAALPLAWLSHRVPDTVRLVMSATAGVALDEARARGWLIEQLDSASPAVVRRMISSYGKYHLRGFDAAIISRIAAAPHSGNTLYLRVLLDELRITAIFENLHTRLDRYLEATTPTELLDLVLERWERDYGQRTMLVQNTLAFLAVSRRGLSERELLELLGNRDKNLPLPQARWAPFYLAAGEFLVNRNGFYWFFHDHLRQAVERRYLAEPTERFEKLSSLADFYSEKISRDSSDGGIYRTLALEIAEDALALAEKIGDKRMMAQACLNCSGTLLSAAVGISAANVAHFDRMIELLHRGCRLAEEAKAWDILADGLIRRAVDETERNPEFGSYGLIDKGIALRRKRGDDEGVRDALRDKARIGMRLNQLNVTLQSLRQAERIQRRLEKPDQGWTHIHRFQYWGEYYALIKDWPQAEAYLNRALQGARKYRQQGEKTAALGWLGIVACNQGNSDRGLRLIKQTMSRERDLLQSQEGVGKWLVEIGRFFDGEGQTGRALAAFWLAEIIYEELQHTALRRTRELLNEIEKRGPEWYRRLRDSYNPSTAEFAEYCSLWGLPPLVRSPKNPILTPQGTTWESRAVFNPTVWTDGQQLHMLYRAEGTPRFPDRPFSSVIGHAVSSDGITFLRSPNPVLVPTESWEIPGGCEDPRLVYLEEYGEFILTYTAYDGITARLAMARCRDASFVKWEKLGPVFTDEQWRKAFPFDRYPSLSPNWSKSGAILPVRTNGLYWMYFGDIDIRVACSPDLRSWQIVPRPVLTPRTGHFDESLVGPGPPPILLEDGILLVYNGARQDGKGGLIYSIGQVLLDRIDPTRVLRRSYRPILFPATTDERQGQTPNVVFAGGMSNFRELSCLYYGMADSSIGVAMADVS